MTAQAVKVVLHFMRFMMAVQVVVFVRIIYTLKN